MVDNIDNLSFTLSNLSIKIFSTYIDYIIVNIIITTKRLCYSYIHKNSVAMEDCYARN